MIYDLTMSCQWNGMSMERKNSEKEKRKRRKESTTVHIFPLLFPRYYDIIDQV